MDSSPGETISVWLNRLKSGDQAAAKPLWDAYYRKLVTLARMKLGTAPRVARDEEDVALSAFASFCRGAEDGRFPRLGDRDDLWSILFTITERKAAMHARHEGQQKRGAGAVVQASAVGPDASDSEANPLAAIPNPEPTPEDASAVSETLEQLLAKLDDGDLRRIAIWKMEGHSNPEITQLLGKSLATVERKLARIREIWLRAGLG